MLKPLISNIVQELELKAFCFWCLANPVGGSYTLGMQMKTSIKWNLTKKGALYFCYILHVNG